MQRPGPLPQVGTRGSTPDLTMTVMGIIQNARGIYSHGRQMRGTRCLTVPTPVSGHDSALRCWHHPPEMFQGLSGRAGHHLSSWVSHGMQPPWGYNCPQPRYSQRDLTAKDTATVPAPEGSSRWQVTVSIPTPLHSLVIPPKEHCPHLH